MTNSPVNQSGNSGIQQVIDMGSDGRLPVDIKLDFIIDTTRGLRTAVIIMAMVVAVLCGGIVYMVVENIRMTSYVEQTLDTINKRHYILSKEYTSHVKGERIE